MPRVWVDVRVAVLAWLVHSLAQHARRSAVARPAPGHGGMRVLAGRCLRVPQHQLVLSRIQARRERPPGSTTNEYKLDTRFLNKGTVGFRGFRAYFRYN